MVAVIKRCTDNIVTSEVLPQGLLEKKKGQRCSSNIFGSEISHDFTFFGCKNFSSSESVFLVLNISGNSNLHISGFQITLNLYMMPITSVGQELTCSVQ